MKCCRKNLFRNQTDPGICWSSASEDHCSKNSNRHSVNPANLRAVYIEGGRSSEHQEDPSRRYFCVVCPKYKELPSESGLHGARIFIDRIFLAKLG